MDRPTFVITAIRTNDPGAGHGADYHVRINLNDMRLDEFDILHVDPNVSWTELVRKIGEIAAER